MPKIPLRTFIEFGRAFPGKPWRPYLARWQRSTRLRFERSWRVRVEIEVHEGHKGFIRIHFDPSSRHRTTPVAERGFGDLAAELARCGYELRYEPRLPMTLFLRKLRATGPRLAAARREIEARFWPDARSTRRRLGKGAGVAAAIDQFMALRSWTPSTCGWSRRLRLRDGTDAILAIYLVPDTSVRGSHPVSSVIIQPPTRAARQRTARLANVIRAAGYPGSVDLARPRGQRPFLFGHFERGHLGRGGVAAERERLDELATALARFGAGDVSRRGRSRTGL